MYDMSGFGKVVAELRKKRGLTQEELGSELNITAQAVSKWENGVGYPDVTMMPFIAEALGVDMETLFCATDDNDKNCAAEDAFEGLPFVHKVGCIACYSDKKIKIIADSRVIFADESVADLKTRTVVNCGAGECRLVELERIPRYELKGNSFDESYGAIESVKVDNIFNVDAVIVRGDGEEARVVAEGDEMFIATLRVSVENCKLRVYNENANVNNVNAGCRSNKLKIYTGFECGKLLDYTVNGSGSARISVGFGEALCTVNGSGFVELKKPCDAISVNINGSGCVSLKSAKDARLKINGSGVIEAEEVSGSLTAKINGSGDITASGNVDTAELSVNGAGDIHLSKLTARVAKVRITGASDIVIGRVIDHTDEKLSKDSNFKVLQRG